MQYFCLIPLTKRHRNITILIGREHKPLFLSGLFPSQFSRKAMIVQDKSLFSIPIFVVGAVLLIGSGYFLITGTDSSGKSQLQIGFTDPNSLMQLESMATNHLMMEIHNPTSRVARIVGNSAC